MKSLVIGRRVWSFVVCDQFQELYGNGRLRSGWRTMQRMMHRTVPLMPAQTRRMGT